MATHVELLKNMDAVWAALITRYTWFIHVTSLSKIPDIRKTGIEPRDKGSPPSEVTTELNAAARNIVCLHPLGARMQPGPSGESPYATLAIRYDDLPKKVGLDWSYCWETVNRKFSDCPDLDMDLFVSHIVLELGSIVSYERIEPQKLRAYCIGRPPTNPIYWPELSKTLDEHVYSHFWDPTSAAGGGF